MHILGLLSRSYVLPYLNVSAGCIAFSCTRKCILVLAHHRSANRVSPFSCTLSMHICAHLNSKKPIRTHGRAEL